MKALHSKAWRYALLSARRLGSLGLSLIIVTTVFGQALPVAIQQDSTAYNLQSKRGVPLSVTAGNPVGSDGRAPVGGAVATPGQYQSVVQFGASSATRLIDSSGKITTANDSKQSRFPTLVNGGQVTAVLRRATVGASFLNRPVSLLFGAVIDPPATDEKGDKLVGVLPEAYWLGKPEIVADAGYHYSPHAKKVFAIQAGPVVVKWVKAKPSLDKPADFDAKPGNYRLVSGSYFTLYTQRYIVSGRPVKKPRTIYWTEGSFNGPLISVPQSRVGSIQFVYHKGLPARVAKEVVVIGESFIVEENRLTETRTIWLDSQQNQIHAHNKEGRIFMEILGDAIDGERRVHLGFEIVDVVREAKPTNVAIDLGELITPFKNPSEGKDLFPRPVASDPSRLFFFRHAINGKETPNFYAIRETQNLNDVLIYWMANGIQGIRWPDRYSRYQLGWPVDVSRYSHYIRPQVSSENEARRTAVPLPTDDVPFIEYQDPLDQPRAKMTPEFKFYTYLEPSAPAHRTLIRFIVGERIVYERVFSWLDAGLKDPSKLAESVASQLSAFDKEKKTLVFPDASKAPRYVTQTVDVGNRISAPSGETGAGVGEQYFAAHINQSIGNSFHSSAYVDPFVKPFSEANLGAIIPVNAIPGRNVLEVLWYRKNGADTESGFDLSYWPAVLARYTIQWPVKPKEIVMASNAGSGPLASLKAKGSIYVQNDRNKAGYNPNEEHGLMIAGQAYALRDDLNVTSGTSYTSDPFVLLQYTDSDGRPSLEPYKVLREKPGEGVTFNYKVSAGTVLQAPLPLGLLPRPVPAGSKVSLNKEVGEVLISNFTSLADGLVEMTTSAAHRLVPYRRYYLQHAAPGIDVSLRRLFIPISTDYAARKVRGYLDKDPVGLVTHQDGLTFRTTHTIGAGPGWGVTLLSETHGLHWNVKVASVTADTITFEAGTDSAVSSATLLWNPDQNSVNGQFNGWKLSPEPRLLVADLGAEADLYSRFTFEDRKNNQWVYRGPHKTSQPGGFEMQYYYKTLEGFYFPSLDRQPAVGTITPYLRLKNTDGTFAGDPVTADVTSQQALPIAYTPKWPEKVPELFMAESLTLPKRGLPAVRGQTSLAIVYQQSEATEGKARSLSVISHDPTREKQFLLGAKGGGSLDKVPASARTSSFQGKTFFPNLAPHLSDRFFFDSSRGANGALVFKGEFRDEVVGDDYLLLNVAGVSDVNALKGLVVSGDKDKSNWDKAIAGLSTTMQLFVESNAVPGTYVVDPAQSVTKGPSELASRNHSDVAVDSYAISAVGPGSGFVSIVTGNGRAFTPSGDPVSVHIFKASPELYRGEVKIVASSNPLSEKLTLQQVVDLAGKPENYVFDWRSSPPIDGQPPAVAFSIDNPGTAWKPLEKGQFLDGVRAIWGGTADVKTLSDNYVIMRYGIKDVLDEDGDNNRDEVLRYAKWTQPQLAEGWIKRVLAGINPFNQRVTDLFNNNVNTDTSILGQAGKRWEGDVALNLETINDFGLIEIYETVLRRGKGLSIDAGINYGPANDALLLAAGYLNDLYNIVGNEAWADAANPTIGIGTQDQTFGDIATSLFAFKGQVSSLLDEELALLRGRDDFILPGVQLAPVYNRLVWNYTRGIDSGEIIYALNYDIREDPTKSPDGAIDATDASRSFPQGHGDAYGHYLSAVKNYLSMVFDSDFTWVPRIESVTVLGQAVSVDYFDERKFAASAAAVARTGKQILDLTWRKDYKNGNDVGWESFSASRKNARRELNSTRYWGMDHWASRVGQGSYLNWIVGNAILPEIDPDPTHEGIQKVDRTTVPELIELTSLGLDLQTCLDQAEAHFNPLGLPEGSIAFDLSPSGGENGSSGFAIGSTSHFEQILGRAETSLQNAVNSFDDAKDVTRLMRSENEGLDEFRAAVVQQETAFTNALIELYGTPYTDDVGPGKTYQTGYKGPDLAHYMYVDDVEIRGQPVLVNPEKDITFKVDIQDRTSDWLKGDKSEFGFIVQALNNSNYGNKSNQALTYNLSSHGFFEKPDAWKSHRGSPGEVQQAISSIIMSWNLTVEAFDTHGDLKYFLDRQIDLFKAENSTRDFVLGKEKDKATMDLTLASAEYANEIMGEVIDFLAGLANELLEAVKESIPENQIYGFSNGGEIASPVAGLIDGIQALAEFQFDLVKFIGNAVVGGLELGFEGAKFDIDFNQIAPREAKLEMQQAVLDLDMAYNEVRGSLFTINQRLREMHDTVRLYRSMLAKGNRIQAEREVFRKRSAAVVQGFRTRDAAFRVFRNEKLERYKSLFDLAARYAFLSAQAYDYDTGLLHTDAGRQFVERIIRSRALGVVRDGEPLFVGSNTGDPGLSTALAEMKADWSVLKGRLGFNNPDVYSTLVSLRTEKHRIVPSTDGDQNWKTILEKGRRNDLLADEDVRRFCMQIDNGSGLPVPGIVLEFQTTVEEGVNLFGRPLAAVDHTFSTSLFATKIFSVGIVFDGYVGMEGTSAVVASGTSNRGAPVIFSSPSALSATPYVYLIPVGFDSMRSPPLGDVSVVRSWRVRDTTIPLPFNIGVSEFSTKKLFQSSDSLSEELFSIRKHQAFRPVANLGAFGSDSGRLLPSEFTNTRLIGRSIWNSKWKLVIPGKTLLADPKDGLDRFIQTVKDVKFHFETYSYSGN
jgi:hypothetical protein